MKRKDVEKYLLEIRMEVEGLSIEPGRFTGGSRGHLLITIDNALVKLGFKPGWESRLDRTARQSFER